MLDLPGTILEANTNYFVGAVGTLASPSVQVAATSPTAMMGNTIADIAAADGRFTTLVAALQAAGLVDTLKGDGPFTVLSPPPMTPSQRYRQAWSRGCSNDIPALTKVLLYHVVPGTVMASDVVNLTSATTIEGSDIAISVKNGEVYLNDTVKVIMTDIQASNGVIHVIDGVLLPPDA